MLLWIAIGVRQIDPADEFGVLELVGSEPRAVEGRWVVAPPGLARLYRYPSRAVEVPLPQADAVRLPGAAGTRYGFRGWITVRARPEAWAKVHAAGGIENAVVDGVRAAGGGLDAGVHRGLGRAALADELETRLRPELAARGIDLRRLDFEGFDYLTADAGSSVDPGTRLLVIGLDGADWAILDPLLEAGRLPNLARLLERGARGKLLTISPMLSPVIWTTVATGVEPSRHGILDFLVQDDGGGDRQPVTSLQRKEPAVWEILNRAGISTGVVGWWATWPADAVDGYMVTDRVAYQLFDYESDPEDATGKTWPPDLYPDVRRRIVAPDGIPWERVERYLVGDVDPDRLGSEDRERLEEFRTLLASGDSYLGIADSLRRERSPRLEIMYLEGTDTVGHLFMQFRPPRLPGVSEDRRRLFGSIVDRYYETADGMLGLLLADRTDDWTVMVLSDHGFASDATRPQSTDSRIGHGAAANWHRRFGVLILAGAHIRPGAKIEEASVYDIAPTILALYGQPVPRSWPGRVLSDVLTPSFLDDHPVRFRDDDPPRRVDGDARTAGAAEAGAASKELLAKLESLGYISGAAGGADAITYRNNRGVSLMAEGRYAEAEAEFRTAMETFPEHPMLLVNLGLCLRFLDREDEAARLFEAARRYPAAMRVAGSQMAQLAFERGDLDGAEAVLRDVLAVEPEAADVLTLLGQVREKKGDAAEAARLYGEAARRDPDAAPPRNRLGNLARRAGRDTEAETHYLAAIEADPYFMGSYNNLALIYQDRGDLQAAIDLYGRALEKSPTNAVVMNNLASLYYARGEIDAARDLWVRCTRVDPSYPSPYNNLAGIAIGRGEYATADALLDQALALDPGYGDARINRSMVRGAQGDPEGAREELRAAAGDPRARVRAWSSLGLLELEAGDPAACVRWLERARVERPNDPSVLNLLGEGYYRGGHIEEARAAWSHSLAVRPDQADVRGALERLP